MARSWLMRFVLTIAQYYWVATAELLMRSFWRGPTVLL